MEILAPFVPEIAKRSDAEEQFIGVALVHVSGGNVLATEMVRFASLSSLSRAGIKVAETFQCSGNWASACVIKVVCPDPMIAVRNLKCAFSSFGYLYKIIQIAVLDKASGGWSDVHAASPMPSFGNYISASAIEESAAAIKSHSAMFEQIVQKLITPEQVDFEAPGGSAEGETDNAS